MRKFDHQSGEWQFSSIFETQISLLNSSTPIDNAVIVKIYPLTNLLKEYKRLEGKRTKLKPENRFVSLDGGVSLGGGI